MDRIETLDGQICITQTTGFRTHAIDDDENNVLENGKYGLLQIRGDQTSTFDIKVKLAGKDRQIYEKTGVTAAYINEQKLLVYKVYATGTTFDVNNIDLFF